MYHSSVNIPFPTEGMADADYLFAFQQIVMPIAYEFAPDLVIGASSHLPTISYHLNFFSRSLCRLRRSKG